MSNTLTGLIPTLYEALDKVSREMTGFIPSVYRNSSAERAAKNQTIRYPIVPATAGGDIAAGAIPVDDGDATLGYADMTISKSRYFPIRIEGEEEVSLQGQAGTIMRDRFAQAFRAAVNEIEVDLGLAAYYASRAHGTAGTTPFASSFIDAASVNRILDDNGCPRTDRSLVVDTAAALNMKGLSNFAQVQAAGSSDGLRNGVLLPLDGLDIRQSAQVAFHTKGGGTAYVINNGNILAGSTALTLGTGNGTIVTGDVLTLQSDPDNKYLVTTGLAAPGACVIAAPGLRVTTVNAKTVTVGNSYRANLAFHKDALHLVTRAPAVPTGGDSADDSYMLVDSATGLAFEIRVYRQYRRVKYEVCCAWGVKMVKPEWAAVLLG